MPADSTTITAALKVSPNPSRLRGLYRRTQFRKFGNFRFDEDEEEAGEKKKKTASVLKILQKPVSGFSSRKHT